MKVLHRVIQAYVNHNFPGRRLDWIGPMSAVITREDGKRWTVSDKKWISWIDLANWLVPATICLWSLVVVSGVVLGCFYGKIV